LEGWLALERSLDDPAHVSPERASSALVMVD
jgi:hypothetical protein